MPVQPAHLKLGGVVPQPSFFFRQPPHNITARKRQKDVPCTVSVKMAALTVTAFERVIEGIEPNNEELTRSLWDAGDYIDSWLATDLIDKLPMPRDEVAYYVDVFLVHHVIGLATEADREAAESLP